jgi:hypothetical protein
MRRETRAGTPACTNGSIFAQSCNLASASLSAPANTLTLIVFMFVADPIDRSLSGMAADTDVVMSSPIQKIHGVRKFMARKFMAPAHFFEVRPNRRVRLCKKRQQLNLHTAPNFQARFDEADIKAKNIRVETA